MTCFLVLPSSGQYGIELTDQISSLIELHGHAATRFQDFERRLKHHGCLALLTVMPLFHSTCCFLTFGSSFQWPPWLQKTNIRTFVLTVADVKCLVDLVLGQWKCVVCIWTGLKATSGTNCVDNVAMPDVGWNIFLQFPRTHTQMYFYIHPNGVFHIKKKIWFMLERLWQLSWILWSEEISPEHKRGVTVAPNWLTIWHVEDNSFCCTVQIQLIRSEMVCTLFAAKGSCWLFSLLSSGHTTAHVVLAWISSTLPKTQITSKACFFAIAARSKHGHPVSVT